MTGKNKDFEYYMGLPYKIVFYPADEGGYVVEIPELPGCLSQGETTEEALDMINDAKKCWLMTAVQQGITISEPKKETIEYSGKLNIRIPKSLHRILAQKAKEEKVSLNQLINYHLASGVKKI
jgi:antitoxin HicB